MYSRLRKSPYYPASSQHGPQAFSVYNHTYHPRYYSDPVDEYWQLLNGVTIWDVGVERQIEFTGSDAFDFVNWLTPRNLHRCAVGQCKYVVLTAEDGGIVNDPVLLRLDDNHFWLSIADSDVMLWARGLAHGKGLDVRIREADVAPIQVQGPDSKHVMSDLFGEHILEVPYYYLSHETLDGMEVIVSRTGYSGESGYEIYLSNSSQDAPQLWRRVVEAGEPYGITAIGPSHIRRIEAGMLSYGCDMTLDTNPFEVGLDWMVNLKQRADFIGKDALRIVRDQGVTRRLAGVEIDGPPMGSFTDGLMSDTWPVYHGGARIGQVTSACYSPRLARNIGYAMVPVEHTEIGSELMVSTPVGEQRALVVEKPFIDPTKERPKE